eukprot:1958475-Pleurochrysis_carterae.AAC.2
MKGILACGCATTHHILAGHREQALAILSLSFSLLSLSLALVLSLALTNSQRAQLNTCLPATDVSETRGHWGSPMPRANAIGARPQGYAHQEALLSPRNLRARQLSSGSRDRSC